MPRPRKPPLELTFQERLYLGKYRLNVLSKYAALRADIILRELHAGETIRYVIVAAKDKVKEWRSKPLALMEEGLEYDVAKYLELLDRAADEVLCGLVPASKPKEDIRKAHRDQNLELPLGWQ